jgi:hypothetical protein
MGTVLQKKKSSLFFREGSETFELKLEADVVTTTNDDAAVMEKFGK